jgi:hypothetical protein
MTHCSGQGADWLARGFLSFGIMFHPETLQHRERATEVCDAVTGHTPAEHSSLLHRRMLLLVSQYEHALSSMLLLPGKVPTTLLPGTLDRIPGTSTACPKLLRRIWTPTNHADGTPSISLQRQLSIVQLQRPEENEAWPTLLFSCPRNMPAFALEVRVATNEPDMAREY